MFCNLLCQYVKNETILIGEKHIMVFCDALKVTKIRFQFIHEFLASLKWVLCVQYV